jgi:putative membrane protein
MNEILEMLSHAPSFFSYFVMGLFFLGVYFLAYTRATQYDEMELIRQGNTAAAYSLIGSALGFSLPLYSAIVHAASVQGFVFWSLIAMFTQICTYYFLKLALKDMDAQIEANNPAYGILEGGISLVVGIINAACVV